MSKAATVQARIDPRLKKRVDIILHGIGLTPSQAINALYAQILLRKGIPFELRIPNDVTLEAINELENGGGKKFASFDDMISDLENTDA